ncbi:hypothetical protein PI86_03985 [Burkholderia sp. A9]|uniref:hypothetical protein n=1 Tax=Burkholderia sp. A9 TaxID=1365108 RepID=UPI0005749E83|nr:hypothetical protein [Burkholderia sp. A9]KHK60177.1 hypothetical protein PI86_03985 [Burkholderia sp. A9]
MLPDDIPVIGPKARVTYDSARDVLIGVVLATGETFEAGDPVRLGERLFAAGAKTTARRAARTRLR